MATGTGLDRRSNVVDELFTYVPGEKPIFNSQDVIHTTASQPSAPPLDERNVQEVSVSSSTCDKVFFVATALWVTIWVVAWIALFVVMIITAPPAGILVAQLLPAFLFVALLPVSPKLALECCYFYSHHDHRHCY